MLAEVMEIGAGGRFAQRGATLHGYRRRLLRGEVYPAVVEAAGEHTDGVLYAGLDWSTLERLDRFEGPYYERRLLAVRLSEGGTEDAFVYVLRSEYASLLSASDWDEATFREHHLRDYLATCRAFVRTLASERPPR